MASAPPSIASSRQIQTILRTARFPAAVLDSLIPAKYIDPSSLHIGTDTVNLEGNNEPFTAVSGTINGNILYLYFSAFAISQAGNNTYPVFDYFFRVLHSGVPALKGIIIDLRGNGGGEISDLDLLVGQMVTSEYTFGYTRYKNGVNRLDYSPWAPAVVKPWVGGARQRDRTRCGAGGSSFGEYVGAHHHGH